mgnify:CR=1 FL=1
MIELSKQVEQRKLQVSEDTPVFSILKEASMPGMKRKNMMGKDMPMMRGGGNMTMKRGGMAKKKTVKKKTKKKAKKR